MYLISNDSFNKKNNGLKSKLSLFRLIRGLNLGINISGLIKIGCLIILYVTFTIIVWFELDSIGHV